MNNQINFSINNKKHKTFLTQKKVNFSGRKKYSINSDIYAKKLDQKDILPYTWMFKTTLSTISELENSIDNTQHENYNPNFINPDTNKHWIIDILNLPNPLGKSKFEIISKIIRHPKFNPNIIIPESEKPLLQEVLSLKPHFLKLRKKTIEEAIFLISNHEEFDYTLRFPINKNTSAIKTTYIEEAIKSKNIDFIYTILYMSNYWDPYDDKFQTLKILGNDNKLINIALDTAIGWKNRTKESYCEAPENQPDDNCDDEQKNNLICYTNNNNNSISSKITQYYVPIDNKTPKSLQDVGGLSNAKRDIENFIIKPWKKNIRKQLNENNIELPNGFLMYGPPGCGKTYIAQVISKQTGFPLFEVNLANAGNSYGHETEKEFEKIFSELNKQYQKTYTPNILFLDEIDAICSSREKSKTDWRRDEINTIIRLLNRASDKGIIVIGATNLIDNIDKAVLRTGRFDKKIEIGLPNLSERKEILEKLISSKKITNNLLNFIDDIAQKTEGKTCSDLNALINTCGRNAIYNNSTNVTLKDFLDALKELEFAKEKNSIGF